MKITPKFKKDLKALQSLSKFIKSNKLTNHTVPFIKKLSNGKLTISGSWDDPRTPTNIKDLVRHILNVLGNSQLKKDMPELVFNNIYPTGYSQHKVENTPLVDAKLFYSMEEDLTKFAKFLNDNKNNKDVIDAYLSIIRGFQIDWEDAEYKRRWTQGVAASIEKQSKERPGWTHN
jgi:hypothetical protein